MQYEVPTGGMSAVLGWSSVLSGTGPELGVPDPPAWGQVRLPFSAQQADCRRRPDAAPRPSRTPGRLRGLLGTESPGWGSGAAPAELTPRFGRWDP